MNAIRDGNHIRIYDAFLAKESIKEIDGRFYSKENVALLQLLGASLDDTLSPDITAQDTGDEVPLIPMPIKATPYQHQIRAYNFALRTFGIGGTA